jgi:hypothetical protein
LVLALFIFSMRLVYPEERVFGRVDLAVRPYLPLDLERIAPVLAVFVLLEPLARAPAPKNTTITPAPKNAGECTAPTASAPVANGSPSAGTTYAGDLNIQPTSLGKIKTLYQ